MNYFETLPNELIQYIDEMLDYQGLRNLRTTNNQLYSAIYPTTYQRLLNDKLEDLIENIIYSLRTNSYRENWGIAFSYEQYIKADDIHLNDLSDNIDETQVILNYDNYNFIIESSRGDEQTRSITTLEKVRKILRTIITNNYYLYDISGRDIY